MTEETRSGARGERLNKWLTHSARRFKPGSWPNRTLHRASDYAWFYLVFKRVWRG